MRKCNLLLCIFMCTLGLSLLFYSCKKDMRFSSSRDKDLVRRANKLEILKKAQGWVRENNAYVDEYTPSVELNLKDLTFSWERSVLDTNQYGTSVLTIPILSTGVHKGYYTELGVVLDKDGNVNGMIKEYMGNPYEGETTLNLYTGTGKLFESGIYRADTKELRVKDISKYVGNSTARRSAGDDTIIDGGTLEGVTVTPSQPPTFPPIIPTFPTFPTDPGPVIPVSPGPPPPDSGGGASGPSTNTNNDIIDNLKDYPCAQNLVKQLPNLKNDITELLKDVFDKNDKMNLVFGADRKLIESSEDGFFDPSKIVVNSGVTMYPVWLNPFVLENSSKEYVLVTLFHEALHAFLLHQRFELGSTDFNKKYPEFDAETFRASEVINGHSSIAANFSTKLADVILSFNPNFGRDNALALAKGGVFELNALEMTININERNTKLGLSKGTKCN